MLREIKVQDFALIESLALRFEAGFNVLTGETGAGKSLIVGALGLATGARASAEAVRSGAKEAVVEALFEPALSKARESLDKELESRGLPSADGVMVVRRIIDSKGRHRVYVNGGIATVATLAELCEKLVALSGQHEQVTFTRPGEAINLLDDFAGATDQAFKKAWQDYLESWEELQQARAAFERISGDAESRAERQSFLKFQISEIDALSPKPGEMEELEAQRRFLAGADRLARVSGEAENALYSSDDSVSAVLARILRKLEDCVELDPKLVDLIEPISSAMPLLSDAGRELGGYSRSIDADPARIEEVESRLNSLRKLARRYGGDLELACRSLEELKEELEELGSYEIRWEDARQRHERAEMNAKKAAVGVTRARKAAASRLDSLVGEGLGSLGMSHSRVSIRLAKTDLGSRGADRAEIGLATDPKAPLRPISKVASGGELSRLLLAFRRAIAEVDDVATLVLDEVDAGIGGTVADAVGKLIVEIAVGRQVLCVTHLPQIAVRAAHHLVVDKSVEKGGSVRISVAEVEGRKRVEEIVRMLGGTEGVASSWAHAEELLQQQL